MYRISQIQIATIDIHNAETHKLHGITDNKFNFVFFFTQIVAVDFKTEDIANDEEVMFSFWQHLVRKYENGVNKAADNNREEAAAVILDETNAESHTYKCDICDTTKSDDRSLKWHQYTMHNKEEPRRQRQDARKKKLEEAQQKKNKRKQISSDNEPSAKRPRK